MTFNELIDKWDWKPIPNCPGRYVLRSARKDLRVQELLGDDVDASEYRVKEAKDVVFVISLDEGGLISYRHEDGSFVHTLNTPEGFQRKLLQLGLEAPERVEYK